MNLIFKLKGKKNRKGKLTGKLKNITKKELWDLYIIQNKTAEEIGIMKGVSIATVRSVLNKFGIKREHSSVVIPYEELYNLYIMSNLTIGQIAEQFNCTSAYVGKKIREYGIQKETKWGHITKEALEKLYLEENLYPMEISEKLNCPFHVVENKLRVLNLFNLKSEKQKEICRQRAIAKALAACQSRSSYEDELLERYPTLFLNNYSTIGKELDLYYPNKKVAIEFNGTYWHSEAISKQASLKHVEKLELCATKGIKLINIFEYQWRDKKEQPKILNIIDNNICPEKLNKVQGSIKSVNKKEEIVFIEDNYIGKKESSDICLGVYDAKDELLSLVAFKLMKKGVYRIVEYATKIGFIEDYSPIIDYFTKYYEVLEVTVACDRSFYNGDIFKRVGFVPMEITKPVGKYAANNKSISRTTYNKNPEKYSGYSKIYDCGKVILKFQAQP